MNRRIVNAVAFRHSSPRNQAIGTDGICSQRESAGSLDRIEQPTAGRVDCDGRRRVGRDYVSAVADGQCAVGSDGIEVDPGHGAHIQKLAARRNRDRVRSGGKRVGADLVQ